MKYIAIALTSILLFAACQRQESKPPASSEPAAAADHGPKAPETPPEHNALIDPADVKLAQFTAPAKGEAAARISTDLGDIVVRLFEKQAPQTVAEFKKLAEAGWYDGRPSAPEPGYRLEITGEGTEDKYAGGEYSLELWNFRGAVALTGYGGGFMVVTAEYSLNPIDELKALNYPESVVEKYEETGGAPHQDWRNTVFGHVIEGMDIADALSRWQAPGSDGAAAPVKINSVKIFTL